MRLFHMPKRFTQTAFLSSTCLFLGYFLTTINTAMAVPKLEAHPESAPVEELPFPKRKLEMKTVENKPYLTWAIKRDFEVQAIYPSPSGKLVYVCGHPNSDKDKEPDQGICLMDPKAGIEWQIVEYLPDNIVGIGKLEGDWVVYAIDKKPQHISAIHLKTGKKIEIGKIETQKVINQFGQVFAVSEGQVFWVNEREKDGVRFGELHQYDLNTGIDRVLYTLPPKNTFVTISASKDRVVFSTEESQGEMRSLLLNLKTKKAKYLTKTLTSQAAIFNDTIVWKGADNFQYGDIWMCKLTTDDNCKPQLIETQKQHDVPKIGPYGMTWITSGSYNAFVFDPDKKQKEVIDQNAVHQTIGGKYMTWIQRGTDEDAPIWIYFSDLSAKTSKTIQKK